MATENKRIIDLINEVANDEGLKDYVSVLPIMCGSGKSTAISEKIRECIESNTGLLVMTDRKKRLSEYLEPYDSELRGYLSSHQDSYSLLLSGSNYKTANHKKSERPVLLMTTQRFFAQSRREEIKSEYLRWTGGYRSLILIDEQPPLYKDVQLTDEVMNIIEYALLKAIDTSDTPELAGAIARSILRRWPEIKADYLANCISYGTSISDIEFLVRIANYGNYKNLLPPIKPTYTVDDISDEDVGANADGYVTSIDAFGRTIDIPSSVEKEQIIQSLNSHYEQEKDIYSDFTNINYSIEQLRKQAYIANNDLLDYYDACMDYLDVGGLFVHNEGLYRSNCSVASNSFYIIMNQKDKLSDLNAKVIILDGTADLTADYLQPYIRMHNCRQYGRKLDNLEICIINLPASRNEVYNRTKNNVKNHIAAIEQFILKDAGCQKVAVFTYKFVIDLINKENAKEKEELVKAFIEDLSNGRDERDALNHTIEKIKDSIKSDSSNIEYMGNLKGRNDFLDYSVFVQLGIWRKPPEYYMSRYLDIHPDVRKEVETDYSLAAYMFQFDSAYQDIRDECAKHAKKSFDQLKHIQNTTEYREFVYRDILADIEQNVFRSPIRNADYKGKVKYYLMYDLDSEPKLKDAIFSRFRDTYGATITELPSTAIDEIYRLFLVITLKSRLQKAKKGKKLPNMNKVLNVIDTYPLGKQFTTKELLNDAGISQNAFEVAKRNPLFRDFMNFLTDPAYKDPGHYIKR